jgi:hypothetical protein
MPKRWNALLPRKATAIIRPMTASLWENAKAVGDLTREVRKLIG